ncbi:hypothetical protein [Pseudoalteromonas sp. Of11M-6]|uniref:hypothetical protein n=1 Tax=Pseudoalteromonas sp. Of11M-6 TaxID=2917754 RepID=UPI001EF3EBDB|nr:hypothetical protein [Pseudoalteromonas sp. Of11M-6]MCG7553087.1 hypothetical protein [Pseudoalteromonas sp. Of11M-6]
MKNQVTDSILHEAIQSAQQGAFFRDSIPDVSETDIENSITWQEYVESFARSNREAQAPQGIEKARLVIRCKSPTSDLRKPQMSKREAAQHHKAQQLERLYTDAALKLSPEKRAEWLGIQSNECLDIETGEVRPKFVAEVEKNHFESPVVGKIEREANPKSNKKPKILKPHYQNNRAHFQTRNWCDGYRIVCTQMTTTSDAPDANTGDRLTTELTSRARGKIIDSGLYMAAVKGGFTAFTTVTLDEKARWRMDNDHYRKVAKRKAGTTLAAIYSPEGNLLHEEITTSGAYTAVEFERSTIGQELSPFLDLVGKMHKRGWTASGRISKTPSAKKYSWGKVECIGRSDRLYPWGKVSSVGAKGRVHTDLMHNNERVYPWGIVECIEQCEARAITNDDMEICKIECEQDPSKRPVFDYIWVAEAPPRIHETRDYPWGEVSSVGHQNYHAHLLMRWNVEPVYFHEWAALIEEKWGQGFVTIERIKNATAAAKYLLKALGYMTKGGDGSQGEIRGNRYNISKYARAEAWENCATHESQHMYGLIQEYMQGLEKQRLRKAKAEKRLKSTIGFAEKMKAVNKKDPTEKRDQLLKKLESQIAAMTEKVQSMATDLNGNFARGGVAKFSNDSKFLDFINWAIGVRGWRLRTVFGLDDDQQHRKEQRQEENTVTNLLVKAQQVIDESIESVMAWYSRFERVSPNNEEYHAMSLVTGE